MACVQCGREDGTIVPAHCNMGKGMALKSSDATVMAICYECHSQIDQPGSDALARDKRRELEERLNLLTLRAMIESGRLAPKK